MSTVLGWFPRQRALYLLISCLIRGAACSVVNDVMLRTMHDPRAGHSKASPIEEDNGRVAGMAACGGVLCISLLEHVVKVSERNARKPQGVYSRREASMLQAVLVASG